MAVSLHLADEICPNRPLKTALTGSRFLFPQIKKLRNKQQMNKRINEDRIFFPTNQYSAQYDRESKSQHLTITIFVNHQALSLKRRYSNIHHLRFT